MKHLKIIMLILCLGLFSEAYTQKYYDEQWKKIADNSKKGLQKSNLPIILQIQKQAMKDNNVTQLILSLRNEFSVVYLTQDDEKNDLTSRFFRKLQETGEKLQGKEKLVYAIFESGFVRDYFAHNSWKIKARTNVNSQDLSQIETWSKLDFKNYVTADFQKLDLQKPEMKNIILKDYKPLFYDLERPEYFPSLLDWYLLNKKEFLSDSSYFTTDELQENRKKVEGIYNELITGNTGNSRLYFVHDKITDDCNVTNCSNKLEQLQELVRSEVEGDYKVLVMREMMEILVEKKQAKEALEVAGQAKKLYPASPFLKDIENEINKIINPALTIGYEANTQGNKPIHVVAEHKNVSQFILNIYDVTTNYGAFLQYVSGSFDKFEKKLVRKELYTLPDLKDYLQHTTALEIKPLPPGIYIAEFSVVGADLKDPEARKDFYFLVSDLNTVSQSNEYGNNPQPEFRLVNSENGKPLTNQDLILYEYVSNKSPNTIKAKTDARGNFKIPDTKDSNYYRYILVQQAGTNNFRLINIYGNNFYDRSSNPNKQDRSSSQIFTDRAVYRPGQTVYFKVINTKIENEKESVIAGLKQSVMMFDANRNEVSSQSFITNEFGSYHGSFVIPKGTLNGRFEMMTDDDMVVKKAFDVEEYKRPKFEITFEPVKDEYKYGQTIELKGKAAMFSGVPLSNAVVSYEVKKQNIRWKYFSWYEQDYDNYENSILGEAKTNEKGEFSITLDLKKDPFLKGIQVDNYNIKASVTDINGETQSSETDLNVASVSYYIKSPDINNTFTDEPLKVKVETKNYNDQPVQKSYHAKLSKLISPDRIIRNNFKSGVQDLPFFSKEEFTAKFPHDLFDKSEEQENWKTEKMITDKIQESSVELNFGKLEAGDYHLELYDIQDSDTIKSVQNFSVWDKNALAADQKTFLTVVQPDKKFFRGEKAKIYAYSAVPDALVTIYIQDGSGTTRTETRNFINGVLEYTIDIPNVKSMSVLNLQFQVAAFNDVQTQEIKLDIKDSEEPLKIETITFRDKVEPGSKEKWAIKVSGDKGEKINAEVLANMYDMSLDQFSVNDFNWSRLYQQLDHYANYNQQNGLKRESYIKRINYGQGIYINAPRFNWYDGETPPGYGLAGSAAMYGNAVPAAAPRSGVRMRLQSVRMDDAAVDIVNSGRQLTAMEMKEYTDIYTPGYEEKKLEKIPVRQNLNETAFFYPDLRTDSEGNVSFEFTSPEALTKWKLMFLAHTKDARAATLEKEVVTQKEFSVTPNYPRFVREGDELNLQSKLSNLTEKKLNGYAGLQILDAFTNQDISDKFGLSALTAVARYNKEQAFSLEANGNSVVSWKIKVPEDVSSVIFKVVAKAGKYSDGEQNAVAVLPNRILVTDALPIFVKEGETKTFDLENLKNTDSKTITNVSNTLELTTNPIWEIMFALPSLKNDPNSSAEVIFNKWFADVLASEIFKANPKIKTVFEQYQEKGVLNSNFEKNQELKQMLLEETPWVLESKNEEEQMQKLALLFDANTMKNSISKDWEDLKKLQNPNGSFSWCPGYPGSYSTSLYILKNLGRINVWLKDNLVYYQNADQKEMVKKLIGYIDGEIEKYAGAKGKNIWTNWTLDYLDSRNYWEKEYPLKGKGASLKNLIKQKAKTAMLTDFTFFGLHRAALLMNDYGLKEVSGKIINYLKETSVTSKTQGIYWKQNLDDWGWFSSKVVNHAGALEAFNKLNPDDQKFIEEMKIWLITQKEVNSWGSSRGTAEVIYTILNSGKSWTGTESDKATIIWGGKELKPETQAAGYVKSTVKSDVLDKNLATVTITKPGPGIVQGGLFWQYYEDLDKIKSSETYLSLTKELYRKIKTINGEELQKITPETPLKVGDKVTVRMILNTDRPMEFIHIKDMRAAGFEPVDVMSGYQWKNSLGYYQSTKDASTNFYIERMPKGKYVFEYDLVANASGKFSNGITTIQNYYAPQMNAHTKGQNVTISE